MRIVVIHQKMPAEQGLNVPCNRFAGQRIAASGQRQIGVAQRGPNRLSGRDPSPQHLLRKIRLAGVGHKAQPQLFKRKRNPLVYAHEKPPPCRGRLNQHRFDGFIAERQRAHSMGSIQLAQKTIHLRARIEPDMQTQTLVFTGGNHAKAERILIKLPDEHIPCAALLRRKANLFGSTGVFHAVTSRRKEILRQRQ